MILGAIADLAGIVHADCCERRDLYVEPRRRDECVACNRHASGLKCLSGAAKRKKGAGLHIPKRPPVAQQAAHHNRQTRPELLGECRLPLEAGGELVSPNAPNACPQRL